MLCIINFHPNALQVLIFWAELLITMTVAKWFSLILNFFLYLLAGIPLLQKSFISHLFMHSYLHGLMDFCFIQLSIICYYYYLFWCSDCPRFDQWESEAGVRIFLMWFHHVGSISFLSDAGRCTWLICFFLSPVQESEISPRSPGPF